MGENESTVILNQNVTRGRKQKSGAHSTASVSLLMGVLAGFSIAFPSEHSVSPILLEMSLNVASSLEHLPGTFCLLFFNLEQ